MYTKPNTANSMRLTHHLEPLDRESETEKLESKTQPNAFKPAYRGLWRESSCVDAPNAPLWKGLETAPSAEMSVHWFDIAGLRIPLAFGTIDCEMPPKGSRWSHTQREAARRQLVFQLWQRLNQIREVCDPFIGVAPETFEAVMLEKNAWGKPAVRVTNGKAPAVSFSYGDDKCWAAVCSPRISLGVDATAAEEFAGPYPLLRGFQPVELKSAAAKVFLGIPEAAALLWSLKEATVKALGYGFHLIDPLEIAVSPKSGGEIFTAWNIHLAKHLMERFPYLRSQPIYAYTSRRHRIWLALVLILVYSTDNGNTLDER